MKIITLWIAASAMSAGTAVSAQPSSSQSSSPQHAQHAAAGEHSGKAGEDRCAQMMSEMRDMRPMMAEMREMRQMMAEMMKMHQGMAAHSGTMSPKDKPHDQPKH